MLDRGKGRGKEAYATTAVKPEQTGKQVEWDVTDLVRQWAAGQYANQGFFLRVVGGKGGCTFGSREQADAAQRPQLALTIDDRAVTLAPEADTFLDGSTYRSQGDRDLLKVGDSTPALLRFNLSGIAKDVKIEKGTLRLFSLSLQGGGPVTIGVFRCRQGHDAPEGEPTPGLAARYPGDRGIAKDPDALFFADFEAADWAKAWSQAAPEEAISTVAADPPRKFEPLQGKALCAFLAKGKNTALNTLWKFKKQTGAEPEEIFFRYYLRLGNDWNQTVDGGKMPGLSGTYGKAGWGGRGSKGTDGWSARGAFGRSIAEGNPLAGRHPIGTYCYHADQSGPYGDIWLWKIGYRGFLENNRWYCIEQYLKLNTPGEKNGILRGWVDGLPAFEKTDIRFRLTDQLKIEQVWMNVYHGGTALSPSDQHLFIDNVVIARKHIGPMAASAR